MSNQIHVKMNILKIFVELTKLTLCLKINGQEKDFSTIVEAWQNTILDNMNTIAEFSSYTMRSSTTTFLANQNSVFKEAVAKRHELLIIKQALIICISSKVIQSF